MAAFLGLLETAFIGVFLGLGYYFIVMVKLKKQFSLLGMFIGVFVGTFILLIFLLIFGLSTDTSLSFIADTLNVCIFFLFTVLSIEYLKKSSEQKSDPPKEQ